MTKALGIDLSLNGTGLIILNGEKMELNKRFEPKYTGVERLLEIENYITSIITTSESEIDLIAIEGYAFAKQNQAHQMGEIGGIMRRRLHKLRIPWIEVTPSQVKKFATGKGNCKKDLILMNVYKRWGVELLSSDEADAFVLAKIAMILSGYEERLTQKQLEVINALRKVV